MNIDLSRIRPNPHRDLSRNPLEPEQVSHVAASIGRTGFWENVVVRQDPEDPTFYQLAYGHNRLGALRERGEESAEFIVKPLSDYDMLVAMIDENATQRNQTVRIIFENITAGLRLGERLLLASKNVEEFNALAKPSHCPNGDNGNENPPPWRATDFERAKNSIESGEGLGRGFLIHFLPDGVKYGNDTIQNAIDSYYADSRKASALRRAEAAKVEATQAEAEAREATRAAQEAAQAEAEAHRQRSEAKRLQIEAEAAVAKAKDTAAADAARREAAARQKEAAAAERAAKAQAEKAEKHRTTAAKKETKAKAHRTTSSKAAAEAEKVDVKGISRELLERLPSASHMREIVQLASSEKIPSEYHERLIQACLDEGWTSAGGRSQSIGHSILKAGKLWWFKASGRADELRARAKVENRQWKNRAKSLDEFVEEVHGHMKDLVRELDACIPFADQVQNMTLASSLDSMSAAAISALTTFRANLPRRIDALPPDLKRIGVID